MLVATLYSHAVQGFEPKASCPRPAPAMQQRPCAPLAPLRLPAPRGIPRTRAQAPRASAAETALTSTAKPPARTKTARSQDYSFKVQVPGKEGGGKMFTVGKADVDVAMFASAAKATATKMIPVIFKVRAGRCQKGGRRGAL
jgi:hypothetical protein